MDLRERVVAAYEKGSKTIAERFFVGQTILKKMLRQKRESGFLERLPTRSGAKKVTSATDRSFLPQQIREQPDATLAELQERLQERKKVSVSPATLSRELQFLRLPRKKSRWSPVNVTTENARGSGDD